MGKSEEVTKSAGEGWTAENDGEYLTIAIKLSNDAGLSGSGKNQMIAKTGGNIGIGGGVIMGLNVYRKNK